MSEKKSLSELKKAKKEERKKWKKEKALKKLKKIEQLKKESDSVDTNEIKLNKVSTVSIAVPGSILENAQTNELKTYLAGQIARAASIFQIDEVVVFDDKCQSKPGEVVECCLQLARILQYLECPQYLRKYFFPIHHHLKFIGLVNPLDTPSHLRINDQFTFREGIVTNKPVKNRNGSAVNVGLYRDCVIDKVLEPGLRVTVKLSEKDQQQSKKIRGQVVSLNQPKAETGVYWGYTVRIANSFNEILTKSPFKKGYDVLIGTSDKGDNVDEINEIKYNHAIIIFGGLTGLEAALENDDKLIDNKDPKLLFDYYLNTIPTQGSRTVRTEEALLCSLSILRIKFKPKHPPLDVNFFQNF